MNILTSFYLAEYDVDYTADHDQGIEDVPGVPDIALIVAACTASGRRGEGRRGREGKGDAGKYKRERGYDEE